MAVHDWIQTVFIVLSGIAMMTMAGVLVAAARVVTRMAQNAERMTGAFENDIKPVIRDVGELIKVTHESTTKILNNLAAISDLLRARAQSADALAADVIERARAEVIRADQFINGSLEMMTRVTEAAEQGVMVPLREITALVAGVRQGVAFFFGRRSAPARDGAPVEEQLFI
ncbi:MAG TPA: hypothetical protein VGZ29_11480 [Terriglobia bacterium]|nr:hypothetical protein [Terriglobia bacterium]